MREICSTQYGRNLQNSVRNDASTKRRTLKIIFSLENYQSMCHNSRHTNVVFVTDGQRSYILYIRIAKCNWRALIGWETK